MQALRRIRRELRSQGRAGPGNGAPDVVHGAIEREYWRTHHAGRDYVEPGHGFRDYEPAYRYGWEVRAGYGACEWESIQDDLAQGWERFKDTSRLSWEEAAPAVREAFHRAGEATSSRAVA